LLLQLVMHARPLAQLDHPRIVGRQAAKGVPIGAQRMPQHVGVAAVVLGTGNTEAITKAVELLGIDGEDLEPTTQSCLDEWPAPRLDRYRDRLRLSSSRLHQPGAQLQQPGSIMPDDALGNLLTLGIEQADMVLLTRPIETYEPANLVTHPSTSNLLRATATPVDPCTGAPGANLLLDVRRGRPCRGTCPTEVLAAQVGYGGSRQVGPGPVYPGWLSNIMKGTGWVEAPNSANEPKRRPVAPKPTMMKRRTVGFGARGHCFQAEPRAAPQPTLRRRHVMGDHRLKII